MDIYEDEEGERDTSVLEFLRRNKQLVIMAVAFVVAYAFMSHASAQMDGIASNQQAEQAAQHQKANPWSVDR